MSLIDVAIVAVLGLAVLAGWWRGLLRPLITWAFIIAGVVVGFGHPEVAAHLVPSAGWRPMAGLLLVAAFAVAGMVAARLVARLLHRHLGAIGLLDRLAGAVVSGALAFGVVMVLLSGMVTLDQAAQPIDGTGQVSAAQVGQVAGFVPGHPGTAILLDPAELQGVQRQMGSSTTPATDIGQLSGPLGFLRGLHAQMVQSRIAAALFGLGQRIPFLGAGQSWPSSP